MTDKKDSTGIDGEMDEYVLGFEGYCAIVEAPEEEKEEEHREKEDPREKWKRAKTSFLRAFQKEGEALSDTEARLVKTTSYGKGWLDDIERLAVCECDDSRFPGVLLGIAPNGNTDRAWVQRCDQCCTFASDEHAAFFVGRFLGYEVGFDRFSSQDYSPAPYLKGLTIEEARRLNRKKKGT